MVSLQVVSCRQSLHRNPQSEKSAPIAGQDEAGPEVGGADRLLDRFGIQSRAATLNCCGASLVADQRDLRGLQALGGAQAARQQMAVELSHQLRGGLVIDTPQRGETCSCSGGVKRTA